MWPNGRGELLAGCEKERPRYEQLLKVLQSVPGSEASRSWLERVNPFARSQRKGYPDNLGLDVGFTLDYSLLESPCL